MRSHLLSSLPRFCSFWLSPGYSLQACYSINLCDTPEMFPCVPRGSPLSRSCALTTLSRASLAPQSQPSTLITKPVLSRLEPKLLNLRLSGFLLLFQTSASHHFPVSEVPSLPSSQPGLYCHPAEPHIQGLEHTHRFLSGL